MLVAQDENGNPQAVASGFLGRLNVNTDEMKSVFGSSIIERLTPIFQTDGVYGVNSFLTLSTTSLSGTVTGNNNNDGLMKVSTGTTIYSQASLQSRRRLRYRAGQGVVGRFTALYTTQTVNNLPVGYDNSYQLAGFGHAEDGFYIGYKNRDFGILYSHHGKREIQTLTITNTATAGGNVTVTIDGTPYTVAVTNGTTATKNAYEVANRSGGYAGWDAEAVENTVVFVSKSAGNKSAISYSAGATGCTGSFSTTIEGVAATEVFIAQADFEIDKLDGTGPSGFTINPSYGNIFQISIGYLGFDGAVFYVKVPATGSSHDVFIPFHKLDFKNTQTTPFVGNPSFPFTMAVYSAGSTTDLSVKCGSFAGFVEGEKHLHGPRFSYLAQTSSVDASAYRPLLTISNSRTMNGRTNQSVINLLSISAACKHTQPVGVYIFRQAALTTGNISTARYSPSSTSIWETAATGVTTSNEQLIWSGLLGETGDLDHHFMNGSSGQEITLQPGESITICAKTAQNTAAYVLVNINTKEDQ